MNDFVTIESVKSRLVTVRGEKFADVVNRNLKTEASETEIELNFAVVKIRHRFIHKGK